MVLSGEVRHELSCASCGAPLHDLKRLRSDAVQPLSRSQKPAKVKPDRRKPQKFKAKSYKRRKGFGARLLDELFDAVEDIFD
ncbi:hypothetical protein [Thalassovita aquimarina]|uniref:hypothetical protein n=1 Tax=Thalassovita aquimarina TaxID=2785917 RepID=UPI00356AB91C